MSGVLPDPSDVVMVVVPTEALKEAPILLDIEDISTLLRVVRWGELVSMILNDAKIADLPRWAKMLGIDVPTSQEVSEAEAEESLQRLERIEHLRPVLVPMIQILGVPTMASLMYELKSLLESKEAQDMSDLVSLGAAVVEALHQSTMSILSSLVELDLLVVNEFQTPTTEDDEEEEEA